MSSFVVPKIDRLTVQTPDGEVWIDVKHRLNAGEYEEVHERFYDEKGAFKPSRVRRAKIIAYVVGWSLEAPVNDDSVKSLEMPVFKAIGEAIETHEDATEAESQARKNVQDGEVESSQTLLSASL